MGRGGANLAGQREREELQAESCGGSHGGGGRGVAKGDQGLVLSFEYSRFLDVAEQSTGRLDALRMAGDHCGYAILNCATRERIDTTT